MTAKRFTPEELAARRDGWNDPAETPVVVQRFLATIDALEAELARLRASVPADVAGLVARYAAATRNNPCVEGRDIITALESLAAENARLETNCEAFRTSLGEATAYSGRRIAELEAENARLKASVPEDVEPWLQRTPYGQSLRVLLAIEWAMSHGELYSYACPECFETLDNWHEDGCKLDAALKAAGLLDVHDRGAARGAILKRGL